VTLGIEKSKNHIKSPIKNVCLDMGFILYIFLIDANKKNAVNNNGVFGSADGVG
jgi:hypothetical protein